jgi:iron complex transport system substrate-binding protein
VSAYRPLLAVALTAVAALSLSACAGGATPSDSPSSEPAGAFPITIEHAFGSTTIDAQPERVATVNWGNHDVPLALGVVPVGMVGGAWGDDDGDGILPWTHDALEALGATGDAQPALFDETDGIDFDGVDAVDPDVVLAAYSGLTEEDYATLQQTGGGAAVVAYPEYAWGTNWRDMAIVNGEALGLRTEAEALVADVEGQIEAALAERPDVAGKTFAYAWIDTTTMASLSVYTPTDARVQFVEDLGLEVAPGVIAAATDPSAFYVDIAAENADTVDADILVVYGDDQTLAKLQADPLLGEIPAVKNGAVVVVPDATPLAAATSGPTVLSIQWVLADYLYLFQAAAEKVQ